MPRPAITPEIAESLRRLIVAAPAALADDRASLADWLATHRTTDIRARDDAIRVADARFYADLPSRRARAIAMASDLANATALASPRSALNLALARILELSGGKPLSARALQDILA